MALSITEVRKIANLARIELNKEEEKRHAQTISLVLDYIDILNEVDTKNVEPTSQVTGLKNVVRADEAVVCKHKKELMAQMPQAQNNLLVVPAVFEE